MKGKGFSLSKLSHCAQTVKFKPSWSNSFCLHQLSYYYTALQSILLLLFVKTEAESSPQPLKDFKDCDSNNNLLEQIITKLDQTQWRVTKHWRHLGQKLKVSKKKLDMIEFCAPFNPTKSLMEYLLAEQNVTVKNFKEKVQQRTGLSAAFKALEPFLNSKFVFMQLIYRCIILQ